MTPVHEETDDKVTTNAATLPPGTGTMRTLACLAEELKKLMTTKESTNGTQIVNTMEINMEEQKK